MIPLKNMDGLILAGGKSSRMGGRHKGFLTYEEETFMERLVKELKKEAKQLWVSYGMEAHAAYEGCRLVFDEYPGCGPLGGLHAGLKACETEELIVAACDMPFLKGELFSYLSERLKDFDGVVPAASGKIHPLAAIYKKSVLPVLEEQIKNGNYRLQDALKKLNIAYIDVSEREDFKRMLQNINTAEDYKKINPREKLMLADALELLLSRTEKIEECEEISLWDAVGRVLSEDMIAIQNQPPFPRSPLDGYAVRSEDILGTARECPVMLKVLEEVDAGHVAGKAVEPGTAVRIMTGAPMPEGADCVIRQEDTDYGEDRVKIYQEIKAYQNYCFEGEDYKAGEVLLKKDTLLGAVEVGVLASLGLEQVPVYRSPRAAVITTGDELVLPGEELSPGKIYNSNLYTLVTRLTSWGIRVPYKGHARDTAKDAAEMIKEAANTADIIITTGGISVGKKDIMHDVLRLLDCERLFWKIEMKPGMPTLCAMYQGKLLICLSGNPYGAAANLELLVRPLLAKLAGRKDLELTRVRAVSESAFPKKSEVTRYIRAYYEDGRVRIAAGSDSSGILSSMCGCNCLMEIPAGTERIEKGDKVWIVLL